MACWKIHLFYSPEGALNFFAYCCWSTNTIALLLSFMFQVFMRSGMHYTKITSVVWLNMKKRPTGTNPSMLDAGNPRKIIAYSIWVCVLLFPHMMWTDSNGKPLAEKKYANMKFPYSIICKLKWLAKNKKILYCAIWTHTDAPWRATLRKQAIAYKTTKKTKQTRNKWTTTK